MFTTEKMKVPDVVIVNDETFDVMKSRSSQTYTGKKYCGDFYPKTKRLKVLLELSEDPPSV